MIAGPNLQRKRKTRIPYISGNYYSTFEGTVSTVAFAAADTLYLYPIRILEPVTIQALGMRVTTGGASSAAKCGIWSDVGGRPVGAPLTGATLAEQATTGTNTDLAFALAANVYLAAGMYWAGSKAKATLPTMVGIAMTPLNFQLGSSASLNAALSNVRALSIADTYASDLATLAAGASFTEVSANVPLVAIRVA